MRENKATRFTGGCLLSNMIRKYDNKKYCRIAFGLIYIFFFCAVINFFVTVSTSAEIVDRIVAVVNDDIITLSDLNQLFKSYSDRIKSLEYSWGKTRRMLEKVRKDILNQLIDQKLTDQEVKRTNIDISEEDIDSAIERIKEQNYYSDKELRQALSKEGITLKEFRKRIKVQILRSKIVNLKVKSKIVITEEDIKSYYENNYKAYRREERYRLRNIIMKLHPSDDEAQKQIVLERMEAVQEKLEAGQPFELLAKTYSESPLAAKGGDLGYFKLENLSPQLQKALKGLNASKFTPILETDQGYQIFYIQEIEVTPGKSLSEVSAEIQEKLFSKIVDKKFQSWLEDLRKRSHIKIIK
jgi:peptidyl-prolyl cis-trans isomerase SurA